MVTSSRLPVLWLCGAPPTGKSTVAWQVFADLADQGLCVGYVDIDQIGKLQPPPAARGWPSEAGDEAMTMMGGLAEAPFVTTMIDTTSRSPLSLAREAATLVTASASTPGTQELPECSSGDVTIVIGPRAVGKSSLSWGMAVRRWAGGERTAYVDLDQVGFLRPPLPDASLQAANLGVIWRNAFSRSDDVIDSSTLCNDEAVEQAS